jgi:hypothetical protein
VLEEEGSPATSVHGSDVRRRWAQEAARRRAHFMYHRLPNAAIPRLLRAIVDTI